MEVTFMTQQLEVVKATKINQKQCNDMYNIRRIKDINRSIRSRNGNKSTKSQKNRMKVKLQYKFHETQPAHISLDGHKNKMKTQMRLKIRT